MDDIAFMHLYGVFPCFLWREKARPALVSHVENMKQYDTVFLGFPNWLAYHNLIQCTQA